MQTHPFDKLTLDNGASFIFTPCPGTKDVDLASSVAQLKDAGAQAVLSLMYDQEITTLEATALPTVCNDLGVKWFQLPIADDDAPNEDFAQALQQSLSEILQLLNNQGTVAVHCKGGSGRTGLVIGLLMLELGVDKKTVIEQVQSIRPKALKHPVQLTFFNAYKPLSA